MRFKISILSVSLSILLSSCYKQDAHEPINFSNEESMAALRYLKEVEWPKAYREQDTMLLDRILAEEFQLIDADGNKFAKADELAWIKKQAMKADTFHYEITRLDIFENGSAIVSGTGHIWNEGQETLYQSSNYLVLRNNLWKAVGSHVSGIREMKATEE